MHNPDLACAIEVASAHHRGQDRAVVHERRDGVVLALADGAGGTSHGAAAAQAIVDAAGTVEVVAHDWCALLLDLDRDAHRLAHGQSTAVIVAVHRDGLTGASAGDSGAWLVRDRDVVDLTHGQARKPLVGGGCVPVPIHHPGPDHHTLLVASDGLLRYARPDDIAQLARSADLASAARSLVELVRLPSGRLQDDVAVVLYRRASARIHP